MTDTTTTAPAPTLIVSPDMLRAALLCASTEQTRYYLRGVYVDPTGKLVATDGHRMFVGKLTGRYDLAAAAVEPGSFPGWIICRDALKRALTGYKQDNILISPTRIGDLTCEPVDGKFPDWTRVIASRQPNGTPTQFNPAYVADMGKIGTLLTGNRRGYTTHFHHNGDGPCGVTFPGCDDAYAVLMPVRASHTAEDWACISA